MSRTNRKFGPYPSAQDYVSAWTAIQQELAFTQILGPGDPQYDKDLADDGLRAIDALYGPLPALSFPAPISKVIFSILGIISGGGPQCV